MTTLSHSKTRAFFIGHDGQYFIKSIEVPTLKFSGSDYNWVHFARAILGDDGKRKFVLERYDYKKDTVFYRQIIYDPMNKQTYGE